MAKKNTKREFSYTRPILIGGDTYPATDSFIIDENGNKTKGKIFTDANGQYYTMDGNNNISPVMISQPLDGVTVSAQNLRKYPSFLEQSLTLSNDNTKVENAPHREYNTHLKENAERGAREHALWDKEHPNAAAWRDAATAVPFAVASYPFIGGAAEYMGGTALGQGFTRGLGYLPGAARNSTWLPWADAALTSYFGANGMQDIQNGRFTPETAVDLAGGAEILAKNFNMFDRMLAARRPVTRNPKNINSEIIYDKDGFPISGIEGVDDGGNWEDVDLGDFSSSPLDNFIISYPLKGKKRIPNDIKKEVAQKYTDFINSNDYQNRLKMAGLEDHWDYMKKLTDRRVNGRNYITGEKYFPSQIKPIIDNNPNIEGQSGVVPFISSSGELSLKNSSYGVTLKEDLPSEKLAPTLMHEIAHWATGNARTIINDEKYNPAFLFRNPNNIVDIMRYNESIAPNISLSKYMNSIPTSTPKSIISKKIRRYNYLKDPQEKRARAMTIYQQAKDNGLSTDAFIDSYTKDGKIVGYAPEYLRDMGKIFTVDNLKKYLRNFLSIAAPIGLGDSLDLNNDDYNYE